MLKYISLSSYFKKRINKMNLFSLILCAVALSMDAFAVAVCKGLALPSVKKRQCVLVGLWFGLFQGLMPTIGYLVTNLFLSVPAVADAIFSFTPWIAFVLLALIGVNMIRESFDKEEAAVDPSFGVRVMFPLAIATSIDALAIGVSYAMTDLSAPTPLPTIVVAAPLIAVTTFLLSAVGVKIGNLFGVRYKSKATLAGGIVLVLLGLKTLLSGLGIVDLPF